MKNANFQIFQQVKFFDLSFIFLKDLLFSIFSNSEKFIFEYCLFEKLFVSDHLFDVSDSQIFLLNTAIKAIKSFNNFLFMIFSSLVEVNFLIAFNNSNGLIMIQESDFLIENSNLNSSFASADEMISSNNLPCVMIKSNKIYHNILISNTSFSNFKTLNGSIIYSNHFKGSLVIKYCIFNENEAIFFGGSIYLSFTGNISLINCSFIKNKALYGGAIFYEDSFETNLIINLTSNKFRNNYASISGGALMFTYLIPKNFDKNNEFEDNLAEGYGENYASEPFRVLFLGKNEFLKNYKENLIKNTFISFKSSPGLNIHFDLKFAIVDYFGQVANKSFSQ